MRTSDVLGLPLTLRSDSLCGPGGPGSLRCPSVSLVVLGGQEGKGLLRTVNTVCFSYLIPRLPCLHSARGNRRTLIVFSVVTRCNSQRDRYVTSITENEKSPNDSSIYVHFTESITFKFNILVSFHSKDVSNFYSIVTLYSKSVCTSHFYFVRRFFVCHLS